MANGIHDGHRDRLKQKFLRHGLDSFEDHEVLELLLFYAIPRCDTNPIAHRLINEFGSLTGVIDASAEELCRVEGIGPSAAAMILLFREAFERYHTEKYEKPLVLNSLEDIVAYLEPLFFNEQKEKAVALYVNGRREVLGCVTISKGSIVGADANARDIAENAFRLNATGVILAHNHPAGDAFPSSQDTSATGTLVKSLWPMSIELADHLIFSPKSYFSMRSDPHLAPLFSLRSH